MASPVTEWRSGNEGQRLPASDRWRWTSVGASDREPQVTTSISRKGAGDQEPSMDPKAAIRGFHSGRKNARAWDHQSGTSVRPPVRTSVGPPVHRACEHGSTPVGPPVRRACEHGSARALWLLSLGSCRDHDRQPGLKHECPRPPAFEARPCRRLGAPIDSRTVTGRRPGASRRPFPRCPR